MPLNAKPSDHPNFPPHGRTGLLLVNLGTPEGTDKKNMRKYLKQFLSDPRVIEVARPLWWLILNGIILNVRPKKSGALYDRIWLHDDPDGSPLRKITRLQAEHLAKTFKQDGLVVDYAMRYGEPSIPNQLQKLTDQGCTQIVVMPLYPQYAASTTATVNDKAFEALLAMRWQPALRTVPPYHDDPVYIDALANSVENHLATLDWEPELIITSFHGIPQSYFKKGDPYHCQCQKTARLLRERLGLSKDRLMITFQSRFGPEEWLQPYTDKTVEALPKKGIKRIAVMNPGFVSDCLETLEEIGEQARESFMEHGGEKFTHIPCLNDSDEGMRVIDHVVARELSGWVN
ncbi:MAG: ferrochelatase [SAR116 cluster bacterium]|nr:ferrochelatase [SAR116 cluster bacterium]